MTRNKLFRTAYALIVPVLAALATNSAYGVSPTSTRPHSQVAAELTEFKRMAFEMRRTADTLHSITPRRQLDWQSHASRLHELKHQVNDLGKRLAQLESLTPEASPNQQMAIEHARPHLVATANNLTGAIEMLNEDRSSIRQVDYAESVKNIYTHADLLHQKLGTILDYDKAKMRLDNLNLEPATITEGS